jgi:DNA-binding beta-propeller fold protein YncE
MISRVTITAAVLLIISMLGVFDNQGHTDFMGKAESCVGGEYFKNTHAEILAYGLHDAGGITADPTGRYIYIAEGNRPLVVYDTENNSLDVQKREGEFSCPDGLCGDLGARDVALSRNNKFVAAHGNGSVLRRADGCSADAFSPSSMEALSSVRSPAGIRISPGAIYVTDDSPGKDICEACAKKKAGGSLYVIPISQDDKGQQAAAVAPMKSKQPGSSSSRPSPNVMADSKGQQTAPSLVRVSEGLHRPSGILPDEASGRVYVADVDDEAKVLRWVILKKKEEGWIPSGYLSSTSTNGRPLPKFLGLASANGMIFAAGPMALYAFKPDGTSMGKMAFDEPVSGVTVTGNAIYLIVGNVLGRIQMPYPRVEAGK